jgi:co-chaperonin GroES (HSP10)
MQVDLQLLPGRVLLKLDPDETRIGRIYLPDNERKRSATAVCIAHEPSSSWREADMTGLHVAYEKWSGKPVVLAGVTYYTISETAILAVLEGDVP